MTPSPASTAPTRAERLTCASSTAALFLGADAGREAGDGVGSDAKPERRALYARGKVAAESRAFAPRLSCETARTLLGWKPVAERERFLDLAVRVHAPRRAAATKSP